MMVGVAICCKRHFAVDSHCTNHRLAHSVTHMFLMRAQVNTSVSVPQLCVEGDSFRGALADPVHWQGKSAAFSQVPGATRVVHVCIVA